ncbi:hypothetical protein SNE35_26490 [Paucibacter sp. R3-3]|uniref:DNA polymerase helix-hairpin-helix motif domain-containing protein n=1 Tax=Roseateles agri TaxID=3098619 RepID=A0ABU5DSL7_9BURK|nr:hypothetical protein [Paucibacter sp. R3-3]MDY0748077.1 hypothetical protein [Paucibacter sp. R3-3]
MRLGLRRIDGLKEESARRIVAVRATVYFESAEAVALAAELEQQDMRLLAAADALRSRADIAASRSGMRWRCAGRRSCCARRRSTRWRWSWSRRPKAKR